MQPRKKRDALTILLVPHSERAPISLRLPVWLLPIATGILVTLAVAGGALLLQYHETQRRINDLLSDQATEQVRQREMRATILSQQDEVRSLSAQVEGFKAELLSVRRLSDEIRDILGLPAPTPAPTPEASEPSGASAGHRLSLGDSAEIAAGGRVALRPSTRSMSVAVERGHELVGMRSAVPAEMQALQELRQLVLERMSRIEKGEHGGWETLQSELKQWAAAPHLWPTYPHPISSEYGYREFRGVYGFHNGIDIAVWYGTPVRATKDGLVTAAGWQSGYGMCVEIQHEAGYSTLFAHHSSINVRVGDKVKAGDVIALAGSSGNSTGPHVHYEIRLWGTPVDPLRYIE